MKKKRIKNDISVKWSLFNKESGEPFILSGKDVSLYLKNMYGRKAVEDFSVQDNQILWTFFGKDQKHTGKYSLELVVNEDEEGMITTDACDFVEIVSCSCKAGEGTDECGVETETIEVQSEVEYVGGGSVTVDTELSETSMNPLANATVTAELKKKVNKTDLATINGQRIDEGGNIEIEASEGTLTAEEVSSTEPTAAFPQVLYTAQSLSDAQKSQARENIGVSEAIEEAIAEIPAPESSVFKAIYGTTTYDEIKAAYDSGKVVHCDYKSYCFVLSRLTEGSAFFGSMNAPNTYRFTCSSSSFWGPLNTYQLEEKVNKVTSLSESSDDVQYPSAKAVYDFVQNSITNVLNEEV